MSSGHELRGGPVRCLRLLPGGRDSCPIDRCGVQLPGYVIQMSREETIGLMFDLLDSCLYTRGPLREYRSDD